MKELQDQKDQKVESNESNSQVKIFKFLFY